MKAFVPPYLSLPLLGVLCAVSGWWLRGATGSVPAAPAEYSGIRPADAERPETRTSSVPRATSPRGIATSPGTAHQDGVRRVQTTDPSDMLAMLEAIGGMVHMSDEEARAAWLDLARRTPSPGFGNSLSVLYLWSRLTRMGEDVEVPPGWGAEQYQQAIETEKARGRMAELRKRMESGEGLSEAERRVVLTDTARTDPLKAVDLWCLSTRPEDYRNDAKWLLGTLSDAGTREGIMERIRKWQSGGNVADVVSLLANRWIASDPAAVEKWLQEPAQADVRGPLMVEVANARALAEPASAWEWSEKLTGSERLQALRTGAMQLAVRDADQGIKLIDALEDPAERETAVKNFANILASRDFDKWQAWRDSLPAAEQAMANESAFTLWVNMDVEQAAGWLGSRPQGEERDGMVGQLVNYYAERDPETCSDWIRTISDKARRKEAAGAALSNVGPYDIEKIRIILAAVD